MRGTLLIFGGACRILFRDETTGLAKLLSLLSVNDDNYITFFSLHPTRLYFSILKFYCTQIVYFTRRGAPWHMLK